ncbi:hypothetical protein P4T44_20325 [Bacillus pseudomycoides]|nr:hypothetical protein [Bacillus pseudomycoides]
MYDGNFFHSNIVQSLQGGKNITLDRMRLAGLKAEKYGNEKMYQLGGKMAGGVDYVTATLKGVEAAEDGTLIGKQAGPGKVTEWVNTRHAESTKFMDGKIQGIEASLAERIRKTGIGVTGEGIPIEEVSEKVLKEIHVDKKAAYGYSPNEGTTYSKYDFTDIEATKNNHIIRKEYLEQSRKIQGEIDLMVVNGASKQEIANKVVEMRNQDKILSRAKMNPEDLAPIEARNMKMYGNKVGPDATWLFKSKKAKLEDLKLNPTDDEVWDAVINGSMKKDDVLNTLLGLKH